jgi:hypothetical protein
MRAHPQGARPGWVVLALVLAVAAAVLTAAGPARPARAATNGAIWPVSGEVTSLFNRMHRPQPQWEKHDGIDIGGNDGFPVHAAQDGTIAFADVASGYGNLVILRHGNGYETYYAHLSRFALRSGTVRQGDVVGNVGSTGSRSTGPHLHFEVRRNGLPINFNSATSYRAKITANTPVNFAFDGLGGSGQTLVANVNACGALYIKRSWWGPWEQHMGCGQAKAVSVSPDGRTIVVVRPDNTLVAKESYWGNWTQHVATGDTQSAAAGPGGMIANVNACGALYIKPTYWGQWAQHMGCGQAKAVSVSANGQTIAVHRPDNTLVAKETLWGQWSQHVAAGDTRAVAAGHGGMLANVNACGALYVKTSYWGAWQQHMGCGQAWSVALSPDGQALAVVRPDNTLVAKETLWGQWAAHTGGDSQAAALARQ